MKRSSRIINLLEAPCPSWMGAAGKKRKEKITRMTYVIRHNMIHTYYGEMKFDYLYKLIFLLNNIELG